jgi:hypothetical protein
MTVKLPPRKPSEILLPARMSINLEALHEVRFAVLDFPYQNALKTFLDTLKGQYNLKYGREAKTPLDFDKKPPMRQLNQAIMACCPVLVHAFEKYGDKQCMVALNRFKRDPQKGTIIDLGDQFPDIDSLSDLIETWLDHWLVNTGLKAFVDEEMPEELATLKAALAKPETRWKTNVALAELIADLDQNDALGYNAIPAAIMALLHGQTMTLVHTDGQPIDIIWRKAHDGGAHGLHLVSQSFHPNYLKRQYTKEGVTETNQEGYFVYKLDVGLETQVGRMENGQLKPWVFLKVGMRRYAHEPFKSDSQRRNLSVLMGFNREKVLPDNRNKFAGYPYDTTLINLPIDVRPTPKVWANNLARLLSDYGLTILDDADQILRAPHKYGNLDHKADFKGNEYYVIHTEGRKYSDPDDEAGRYGHGHEVKVGLSLKQRTEMIQRVLELLPDVLIPDRPFESDIKAPQGVHTPPALRDFEYFDLKPSDTPEERQQKVETTVNAIRHALQFSDKDGLDIALLCVDTNFAVAVMAKIRALFPDCEAGKNPFLHLHVVMVAPRLQQPLSPGDLNPKDHYNAKRAKDFYEKWNAQMQQSRAAKVQEWATALSKIKWRPDAHRATLIESYYEVKAFKAIHESQEIKGAIREACSRAGVASQFIAHFDVRPDEKLSAAKNGHLETALLDLLLRNTATMYGTPADLYLRAARIAPEQANIDVIAFWHVQTHTDLRADGVHLVTIVALRLRANGHMEIRWPGLDEWIPYAKASARLGVAFADLRSRTRNRKDKDNPLNLKNSEAMAFVRDVLLHHLTAPTIAVIPADWWRYSRSNPPFDTARWSQLTNKRLFKARDVLDFSHLQGGEKYTRDDARFQNLLAVIRLRKGSETPQYTVGTLTWDADKQQGDLAHLSGYVDCTVTEPLHYFSIAGKSDMQKGQFAKDVKDGYKTEIEEDYAYKHAQLIELLPFFVRDDFRSEDGYKLLCRCVHFLRVSPAFSKGNILLPYPMHLAKALLEDLMCIVDAG